MIVYERRGAIAIVKLSRPEARNAINRALEQQLYDALETIDLDPEVRVGVIAATGTTFCAGADLKEIGEKGNPNGTRPVRESIVSRTSAKPLIAAVEGGAYGGGMELVLACDLTVASHTAKFALSEVRWGLLPSGGGMFRLPKALPQRVALQMLLTSAPIGVERAYELGLVNEVTEPGEALTGALAIAELIAANGPLAIRLIREMVARSGQLDETEAWQVSRELVARNFESLDAKEGPRAFAEKRAPNWIGA